MKFYEKFEKKTSKKESKEKSNNKSNDNLKKSFNSDKSNKTDNNKNLKNKNNKFDKNQKKESNKIENYTIASSLFDKYKLTKETNYILQHFDQIVQGVRPLNSKQLQQLPDNIKALSHQLTDKRSERRLGYMNDNIQLSSYVRYYTWWNLVRLTRLFSNLPSASFPDKDGICIDLGTGPLTVINALWLARPELRKLKLTWYCLDVSANSMVLGEDLYYSIAAKTTADTNENIEPWNIIRVKGSFGTSIKEKADFITCANMFNELDQESDMPPEYQTKKYFQQLKNYSNPSCKFLLIEPGVPKATRTITLLRERFIDAKKEIIAPCPHLENCPMNGFKAYTGSRNKWCNFAFSTEDAPEKLLKLSEQSKLPKERATLIFISVVNKGEKCIKTKDNEILCRITSDPFRLPENKVGYYACSSLGLTLLKTKGKIYRTEEGLFISGPLKSGDLIKAKVPSDNSKLPTDEKSGALIISL